MSGKYGIPEGGLKIHREEDELQKYDHFMGKTHSAVALNNSISNQFQVLSHCYFFPIYLPLKL